MKKYIDNFKVLESIQIESKNNEIKRLIESKPLQKLKRKVNLREINLIRKLEKDKAISVMDAFGV